MTATATTCSSSTPRGRSTIRMPATTARRSATRSPTDLVEWTQVADALVHSGRLRLSTSWPPGRVRWYGIRTGRGPVLTRGPRSPPMAGTCSGSGTPPRPTSSSGPRRTGRCWKPASPGTRSSRAAPGTMRPSATPGCSPTRMATGGTCCSPRALPRGRSPDGAWWVTRGRPTCARGSCAHR